MHSKFKKSYACIINFNKKFDCNIYKRIDTNSFKICKFVCTDENYQLLKPLEYQ